MICLDKEFIKSKKIDFETHFVTEGFIKFLDENSDYPRYIKEGDSGERYMQYKEDVKEPHLDVLLNKLLDLGKERLKNMDQAGVDVQVLSLTAPGVEQFDAECGMRLAKETNDELFELTQKYPDRFIGFAALAPDKPEAAANELERVVEDLGFEGWKTHSNYNGNYLDEEKYRPVLKKAEELDVPIYLHPTVSNIPALRKYGFPLAGAPFGFGIDTAICMMRLILSGMFDEFPDLKIMLGHLGETLPFLLERMDFPFVRPWFDPELRPDLNKKPSEYFKENVFVTTSGNYLNPAFMCTYEALGVDRILFGVDYPYEDYEECIQFIESLPLSQEEKDKIYFKNASQLNIEV